MVKQAYARISTKNKHYYLEVLDSRGKIVVTDDCRSLSTLMTQARKQVFAVRTIEDMGHRLKPYRKLVDEAAGWR